MNSNETNIKAAAQEKATQTSQDQTMTGKSHSRPVTHVFSLNFDFYINQLSKLMFKENSTELEKLLKPHVESFEQSVRHALMAYNTKLSKSEINYQMRTISEVRK